MSEKLSELLSLSQRAEKMEYINEESALNIYVDIFARFEPKVSKTYDSAIRLLEKRDRLEEALIIADKAIAQILADEMSAGVDKYRDVKERLERKLRERGVDPSAIKHKKNTGWKPILAIIGFTIALLLVLLFATPYGRVLINLDGKQGFEDGEPGIAGEEKPQYPITQRMIDYATKAAKREAEVLGASIAVQDFTVTLTIITATADVERARELATSTLRYLSGAAAAEYPELKASRSDDPGDRLGQLFDFYDVAISVATGTTDSQIYLRATMQAGGASLQYSE